MKHLVTGAAGFIGFHTCAALLERGDEVYGLDVLNSYYDPSLKRARIGALSNHANFHFTELDICTLGSHLHPYQTVHFDSIVHLAAQAGVRHSIDAPGDFVNSNLTGFSAMLEFVRAAKPRCFVFASSSSVYGLTPRIPFSIEDSVMHPISFYGATKVANEAMAFSYHHLFAIPMYGLRFFTVYGPWGRPDMAYYKFAHAISGGSEIQLYSGGNMRRSFTYIDDVVFGICRCVDRPRGFEVLNIGNDESVELMHFLAVLEKSLGKKALIRMLPPQPGDMQSTAADITRTRELLGFSPKVRIDEGIPRFIEWFKQYHGR